MSEIYWREGLLDNDNQITRVFYTKVNENNIEELIIKLNDALQNNYIVKCSHIHVGDIVSGLTCNKMHREELFNETATSDGLHIREEFLRKDGSTEYSYEYFVPIGCYVVISVGGAFNGASFELNEYSILHPGMLLHDVATDEQIFGDHPYFNINNPFEVAVNICDLTNIPLRAFLDSVDYSSPRFVKNEYVDRVINDYKKECMEYVGGHFAI